MSAWIGKTPGKVCIESLVALDGTAVVSLGTHTALGRPVVVKFLHNDYEMILTLWNVSSPGANPIFPDQ
jgi:hypothetical protein